MHRMGQRQAAAIDEAREYVAALVGGRLQMWCLRRVRPNPIIWR